MESMITDPREMRKRMQEVAYGYIRVDGKECGRNTISPTSSMIRSAFDKCRHEGCSGEDTMTLLAFLALMQVEVLTDITMEDHFKRPLQPVIITGKDFIG